MSTNLELARMELKKERCHFRLPASMLESFEFLLMGSSKGRVAKQC